MENNSKSWDIVFWIIGLLFITIGILNIIIIHPVPGIIYIVVALIYLPFISAAIKKKIGFSIPITLKVILAIAILWFTLGVGDLMEYFESQR